MHLHAIDLVKHSSMSVPCKADQKVKGHVCMLLARVEMDWHED